MSMTPLFRLVYVSTIASALSDVELLALVGSSQMRNRRLDVTGVLVRGEAHFAQMLEGRRVAIEAVMDRVARDRHHVDIVRLAMLPITRRQCGRWEMRLVVRDELDEELARLRAANCLESLDLGHLVEDWDLQDAVSGHGMRCSPVETDCQFRF